VLAACEFLSGQCEEDEETSRRGDAQAALNQDYEKAAELRDTLTAMRRTTGETTRFERTPWNLPVSVMPEARQVELAKVLDLRREPRCASRASTSRTSAGRCGGVYRSISKRPA